MTNVSSSEEDKVSFTSLRPRSSQFSCLNRHLNHPDCKRKTILDFGGSIGGILRDQTSTIEPQRYWCIDVSKDAVARGRALYPRSHWIFYDRYSFDFNPQGIVGLEIPKLGRKFDFILAYSVFTHIGPTEMVDLVRQLEALLAPDGILAFTFFDHRYIPWPGEYEGNTFQWRMQHHPGMRAHPEVDVVGLTARAVKGKWCVLINYEDLYVESDHIKEYELEEKNAYIAFYSREYISRLFPYATISAPCEIEKEHHFCIIRKGTSAIK